MTICDDLPRAHDRHLRRLARWLGCGRWQTLDRDRLVCWLQYTVRPVGGMYE